MKLPTSTPETSVTMNVASSTEPSVTLVWSVMDQPTVENEFARGLARFQIAMRRRRIGQRIGAVDPQAELAGVDPRRARSPARHSSSSRVSR